MRDLKPKSVARLGRKSESVVKPFPDINKTNDEWASMALTLCENSTDAYFRDIDRNSRHVAL